MRAAILSPIAWRTPPRHYGPWESIASLLTEKLVERGLEVTLFATADSETAARLDSVCPRGYEEDRSIDAKVWECLHIANCFEKAGRFDIIHNHYDFLPLTYSGFVGTPVLTTIHGFSSESILPVYRKYNQSTHYVSISNADRVPGLKYERTIYHGIDPLKFTLRKEHGDYLLFFGRIHPDKGTADAIKIAHAVKRPLIIAGIIQDADYFNKEIAPHIDDTSVAYIGSAGPQQRNEILGNAFALLHPIHFNEPFGLSIIEAMACGTPAIAFRKGSMPELITDGVDGYLVDNIGEAVDAVARIRKIDPEICRRTVEARFTADRMVDEYIEVYDQITEHMR